MVGVVVGEHKVFVKSSGFDAPEKIPLRSSVIGMLGSPDAPGDSVMAQSFCAASTGVTTESSQGIAAGRRFFRFNIGASLEEKYFSNTASSEKHIVTLICTDSASEAITSFDANGSVFVDPNHADLSYSTEYSGTTGSDAALLYRYSSGVLTVYPDAAGDLSGVTDEKTVYLAIMRTNLAVCAGADSSSVAFDVKSVGGDSLDVQLDGAQSVTNGVLFISPNFANKEGFLARVPLAQKKPLAWSEFLKDGGHTSSTSFNSTGMSNIMRKFGNNNSPLNFTASYSDVGHVTGTYPISMGFAGRVDDNDLVENTLGYIVDAVFSAKFNLLSGSIVETSHAQSVEIFAPFIGSENSLSMNLVGLEDGSTVAKTISRFKNVRSTFLAALPSTWNSDIITTSLCETTASFSIDYFLSHVLFMAVARLSLDQSSIIVVPGSFPGGSATTTPLLASQQIAAFLGHDVHIDGGITPTSGSWGEFLGPDAGEDYSTLGKQELADLAAEAWQFISAGTRDAVAPSSETFDAPEPEEGDWLDIATEPEIDYDYIGTESQTKAKISNVDEAELDPAQGDGHYWSGWKEKDAFHLLDTGSARPVSCMIEAGGNLLAVGDAIRVVYLSSDNGAAWSAVPLPDGIAWSALGDNLLTSFQGVIYCGRSQGVLYAKSSDAGLTWEALTELPTGFAWNEALTATDGTVTISSVSHSSGVMTINYVRGTVSKSFTVPVAAGDYAITPRVSWDAEHKQFLITGGASVLALGDPSLIDIWSQCHASYLHYNIVASKAFKWRGLHDPDEIIHWMLDCKDGIDSDTQATRLEWMIKPAWYYTLHAGYDSISDQLSCRPGCIITVPRQRLEASSYGANVPVRCLVTKVSNDVMTGKSSIQVVIPPK